MASALAFDPGCTLDELFSYAYGSFILELTDNKEAIGLSLGTTTETGDLTWNGQTLTAQELLAAYEGKLEPIYPCNIPQGRGPSPPWFHESDSWKKPLIKAPQPGCSSPSSPAPTASMTPPRPWPRRGPCRRSWSSRTSPQGTSPSPWTWWPKKLAQAQMVFLPGGFSGGDEPDGSAKLITSFFRAEKLKDQVHDLLKNRDGLMLGICNGFQALIKLGLVPYGRSSTPTSIAPPLPSTPSAGTSPAWYTPGWPPTSPPGS